MLTSRQRSMFPGGLGPFVDENPLLTHAHIRPYIIAILLHRGAVSFGEILAAVSPHAAQIDLKVGAYGELDNCDPDKTRLELLTEEVLGEMVIEQLIRYNDEKSIWVLSLGENKKNLTTIIGWVSVVGGQIPHHLLIDKE
jgi:hypothetical protein